MTIAETAPRPITAAVVILTPLAWALFALGWLLGKVSLPLSWMAAAIRVGFAQARDGGQSS